MKEDAVSEVIGTILLLLVVAAAAGVFTLILTDAVYERTEYVPTVSFQESASGTYLYHAGGDSLQKAEIRIFAKSVDITDRTTIRGESWEIWQTGDALYPGGSRISEITVVGKSSLGREVLLYEGLKRG